MFRFGCAGLPGRGTSRSPARATSHQMSHLRPHCRVWGQHGDAVESPRDELMSISRFECSAGGTLHGDVTMPFVIGPVASGRTGDLTTMVAYGVALKRRRFSSGARSPASTLFYAPFGCYFLELSREGAGSRALGEEWIGGIQRDGCPCVVHVCVEG
jgi:hypothetical protein